MEEISGRSTRGERSEVLCSCSAELRIRGRGNLRINSLHGLFVLREILIYLREMLIF